MNCLGKTGEASGNPSDSVVTRSKGRTARRVLIVGLVSVICGLLLAEVAVKIMPQFVTNRNLDFEDAFRGDGRLGRGGALKEKFREFVIDGYGGTVLWVNNSEGFRSQVEYSEHPPDGFLRIMSLGDSFIAGYRVGQEETFSFLLEKWLNAEKNVPSEVMIVHEGGGGCPVSGLYYLTNYGKHYFPDIVLLGITIGNDIAQAYLGLHRDGTFDLGKSSGEVSLTSKENNLGRIGFL